MEALLTKNGQPDMVQIRLVQMYQNNQNVLKKSEYRDGARSDNLVVMWRAAAARRRQLVCQNLGGIHPPPSASAIPGVN
jgi:hypothetical protein